MRNTPAQTESNLLAIMMLISSSTRRVGMLIFACASLTIAGSLPSDARVLWQICHNWDHKDARDGESNTGVLQCKRGRIYYVTDWGRLDGKWGRKFFHNKWDCESFAEQTPAFIRGVEGGEIRFGFSSGRRADEFKSGITVSDVRWIARLLSRFSDEQLRLALRSSGADEHEADHFTAALRLRIQALERVGRYVSKQAETGPALDIDTIFARNDRGTNGSNCIVSHTALNRAGPPGPDSNGRKLGLRAVADPGTTY
jgi:hypothetical protein